MCDRNCYTGIAGAPDSCRTESQIRGPTLRDERLEWNHRFDAVAPPLPATTSSYGRDLTNNLLLKSILEGLRAVGVVGASVASGTTGGPILECVWRQFEYGFHN